MQEEKKSKPAGPSKKEFILGRSGISAKEVVKAAAKEGLQIKESYVYVVRSDANTKPKTSAKPKARASGRASGNRKPRKPARAATRPKSTARKPPASGAKRVGAPAEASDLKFVDLVLDIGLARADDLLGKVRRLGTTMGRANAA